MTGIPATLDSLRVPVAQLKPYGRNPRVGNVETIAESLRVNGQYRPIVVRAGIRPVREDTDGTREPVSFEPVEASA